MRLLSVTEVVVSDVVSPVRSVQAPQVAVEVSEQVRSVARVQARYCTS